MRSPTIVKYSISIYIAALLAGCSNALYFYETEKISLTVEARPDSSQPVQGSLGIKQRVALVSPKTMGKQGDALSAISSFSFKIDPKPGTIFNPVLIQTAFVTGDAAANLNMTQTANIAAAIVPNGVETLNANQLAELFVGDIDNETDRNTLKQITTRDFESLSNLDYVNISRIIALDHKLYTRDLHRALGKILANY